MNQNGKIMSAVVVTAIVVGGGMYLFQQKDVLKTDQDKTAQNVATTNVVPSTNELTLQTDEKSGIRFSVPDGWTVGPDESGNTYAYRENPYRVVTFKVFADKASWQTVVNSFAGLTKSTDGDKWVKNQNVKVGGLSTTLFVSDKSSGSDVSSQNGEYFVDNGTKWFQISVDDVINAETQQIIQSIKF